MDEEKKKEIRKKMMKLKIYRNRVIKTKLFLDVCKLIDMKGLEDRRVETIEYIRRGK